MVEEYNYNYEEENIIWIINEEGKEEVYEIFFDFDFEDFDKFYVLYFLVGKGEDEEIEIFVFSYI